MLVRAQLVGDDLLLVQREAPAEVQLMVLVQMWLLRSPLRWHPVEPLVLTQSVAASLLWVQREALAKVQLMVLGQMSLLYPRLRWYLVDLMVLTPLVAAALLSLGRHALARVQLISDSSLTPGYSLAQGQTNGSVLCQTLKRSPLEVRESAMTAARYSSMGKLLVGASRSYSDLRQLLRRCH